MNNPSPNPHMNMAKAITPRSGGIPKGKRGPVVFKCYRSCEKSGVSLECYSARVYLIVYQKCMHSFYKAFLNGLSLRCLSGHVG